MIPLHKTKAPAPLSHSWQTTIAMGRAYELLREDAQSHLTMAQEALGFSYCRFHGLFHDDMAVCRRREDGTLGFQWHQVDKIIDFLLEIGLRPFVELNPMPACIASGSTTMFEWKMNITPPAEWEEWGELVREFTRHCVSRYGIAEVREWYFEVWNEPNLGGFWTGTKEEYFQLYDYAVNAVRSIDSKFRVGGPASSKGAWVLDLIDHCVSGNIPVDFVSTHFYPQDMQTEGADKREGEDGADFFIRMVKGVREEVENSPLPDLEIHFTEWNTLYAETPEDVSWVANPSVDDLRGAALVARMCSTLDETVDSLCYWTATDIFEESGMPHAPFSGTYGLFDIHGNPKPNFHAFRFLGELTGDRLEMQGLSQGAQSGIATQDGERMKILLWNQLSELGNREWQDELQVPFTSGKAVVVANRLADKQGSSHSTWLDLGKPQNLTPATERLIAYQAEPSVTLMPFEVSENHLHIPFNLKPGEVLLLEIEPAEAEAMRKGKASHEVGLWDKLMNEKSK